MTPLQIWMDVSGSNICLCPCYAFVAVHSPHAVGGSVQISVGSISEVRREHLETTAARIACRKWPFGEVIFYSDSKCTVEILRKDGFDFRMADKSSVYHILAHTAAGGERYRKLYERGKTQHRTATDYLHSI